MSRTAPAASASASTATARVASRRTAAAVVVGLGAVIAAISVAIVAAVAIAAGASPTYPPLTPMVYLTFTLVGYAVAVAGWVLLARRPGGRRALPVLVPVLTALSLVPNAVLLVTPFIPGTSVTSVVALMLTHLVVAGVATGVGMRIAPLR